MLDRMIARLQAFFQVSYNRNLVVASTIFLLTMTILFLSFDFDEEEFAPCADNGYPGRCYTLSKKICKAAWTRFENDCRAEFKQKDLGLDQPGRLMGPVLYACQATKYDKVFRFMRTTAPEGCEERFADLEKLQNSY